MIFVFLLHFALCESAQNSTAMVPHGSVGAHTAPHSPAQTAVGASRFSGIGKTMSGYYAKAAQGVKYGVSSAQEFLGSAASTVKFGVQAVIRCWYAKTKIF